MSQFKQGSITVELPPSVTIPEQAGKLSPIQISRLEKPRKGIGLTCQKTSEAMLKYAAQLAVPGVDATKLAQKGQAAEDIDTLVFELEAALSVLKQANRLLDDDAHRDLRKVLAFVRGQEKFDPGIVNLLPSLIDYFANARPGEPEDVSGGNGNSGG